jgi:transposase
MMNDKQAVYGVDVAKATLECAMYEAPGTTSIANSAEAIGIWLSSLPAGSTIAMEATGCYHRLLAVMAHGRGMRVFILNPHALNHYARGIGLRAKTDPVDAQLIARYAMHEQKKLIQWRPAAVELDRLSQLLQRRDRLVNARKSIGQSLSGVPMLKQQRHTLLASLKRMIENVELLMRQELARTPQLVQLHRRLSTIVGVGFVTACQLVACLSRFTFKRVDSFIAYTGLDPRPDDSGERRGRRVLSKQGPRLLRQLLYTAGMAAAHSKLFKPTYSALLERGLKTTEAIVILARKIARIAFALHCSGSDFEPAKHLKPA